MAGGRGDPLGRRLGLRGDWRISHRYRLVRSMRIMRLIGKLLTAGTVGVLLLTGCAGEDDPEESTPEDQPQATTETAEETDPAGDDAAATTDDGGPADDGDDGGATSEDPADDTAGEENGGDDGTEGEDQGSGDTPGDPREVLDSLGLLDGDKVRVDPAAPMDPGIARAMCEYVFGKPAQVAEVTGVTGELTLLESSGYEQWPAQGDGLQCIWDVDGANGFGTMMWSQQVPTPNSEEAYIAADVPVGDFHGVVAYAPDYEGTTLDEDAATAWLEDAATRWAGASD